MENIHPRILSRGREVMQAWDVTKGIHGDSEQPEMARWEVAVIPDCRAGEKKALPEARGELWPWCRFLGRSWAPGVVMPGKRRETAPSPPPWISWQ